MPPATPPYPISPIAPGEQAVFERATALAFGETLTDEEVAHHAAFNEPERTLAARDGDLIVGTALVLDFTMTVPYAPPVSCPGVTSVGVRPTHRRRGVLASLMRRQLDDLRDHGETWAALYASEAGIYGRFGYGMASRSIDVAIDRQWARLERATDPAAVDLLTVAAALERVPAIYAAARTDIPGMMSVSDALWRHHLDWDPDSERDGASARFIAAIDERAYATYRIQQASRETWPDGTVRVEECIATDRQAYRQMWAYLFGIDLTTHVTATQLAVDDPLPWWLADRGRLRVTDGDPCYVRLIDVGGALTQRGTLAAGGVVLDVRDAFCPWNTRRWMLEGDGTTLSCTEAQAPADVALDVRELASLSLGGVTASELARAGLVDERTEGAVRRLDALLASDCAPWNPFEF